MDAERVRSGHGHDGDGHGGTIHVDGGAQRNRYGIYVLIEAEFFAQLHIDRNVRSGGTGEERGHAGFLETTVDQWIRIAAQVDEDDQRSEYKHHEQHGADKQKKQRAVLGEGCETVIGHIGEHKAHDAERSEVDDPTNHLGYAVSHVGHERLGAFGGDGLHGQAEQAGPHENADVVAIDHGLNRIGHDVGQQRLHHFGKALRHHIGLGRLA